jgi:hypothetical protein
MKRHLPNVLSHFRHWMTKAVLEGINSKNTGTDKESLWVPEQASLQK